MTRCRFAPPSGLLTDPLLTAAPGDFDPQRRRAPHPRRLRLVTQRYAPDGPVHTQTLVFTVGLKTLPVTIDYTIVLTACPE